MAVDSGTPSPLGPPACEKDRKPLQFIQDLTTNLGPEQVRVLAEILTRNSDTEYLQRFHLDGATDRDTFKSRVPVVTYEDLLPDIKRIADGDRSPILSSHPISEFLTSSGTSAGERKLMPAIQEDLDRRQFLYSLLTPVMNLYVPGLDKGKALYFYFIKAESKTAGGIPARPVLTSYYKSDIFKKRPYDPYNVITSPTEAILCVDYNQSMYTQMLCGLIMRLDVLRVGAVFASGLLKAIHFLELNWAQLAHDIRTGTLNPKITDPSIRNSAPIRSLKPDPTLADFITSECSSNNFEGIVTRIWPNTKYLDVIVTGAMAQYIPTLEYYSNGLPMTCTMYASSESYFGLNLNPMCKPEDVSYTLMPNMCYYEFLPHDPTKPDDHKLDRSGSVGPTTLIDLAEVELGKEYELIITTYAGLCRYMVGDVLRVTGFHNAAPQFKFIRRKNVLLSVDSDKTDESELQRAVESASRVLMRESGTRVVEYTSYADTKAIPGHYVIYWEVMTVGKEKEAPGDEVMEACCLAMEEELNSVYRQGRAMDSIGPLEIRVVRGGTFEELMDYAISRGASINQYKVPRCVSFTPIMELLDARVVSKHFSPKAPHFSIERRG